MGVEPNSAGQAQACGIESAVETAAAEALRRAKEELARAQQAYERIRAQAAEQIDALRERRVGDVIDATVQCVKRHPGQTLVLATIAGFFLGRFFRR
jgi:ElaB/YqjD/DUF883 family membrane-anchored ribosome-binding protein